MPTPSNQENVTTVEVAVIGAGPGGSAAATYAARAGYDVLLIDSEVFPRDKTCGDGLTPRAITELHTLGLTDYLSTLTSNLGLELSGWGNTQKILWPAKHFGSIGAVAPRISFDTTLRNLAESSGAQVWESTKAVNVSLEGKHLNSIAVQRNGQMHTVRAKTFIIADGVKSTLGKQLGRTWHRTTAYGVAARAYIESDRSNYPWMGSHIELKNAENVRVPGYGWLFPLGQLPSDIANTDTTGTNVGGINIGVGTLATEKRPAKISLKPLLHNYVEQQRDNWQLHGDATSYASALLPMGGAVSTISGKNWMLIGDAAACVNPLNGEGIDYALETARFAANFLDGQDLTELWPQLLRNHYGLAFAAARQLAGLLTLPITAPALGIPGLRSATIMQMTVRVMGNLLTAEDTDFIARSWRALGFAANKFSERTPFS